MAGFRRFTRWICCIAMLVIIAVAGYNIVMKQLHPKSYEFYVQKYSREYDVSESLIFAVIKCESNFKSDAVSKSDARGLMQLTEETFTDVAKMLDEENVLFDEKWSDVEINIKYGTRYIKYLLDFFEGDKLAAIAAYNAGMGNVVKWADGGALKKEDIKFKETADYVDKVLSAEEYYEKEKD